MAAIHVNTFFRSLNDRFEPSVKTHLKNVYSCLAISTLSAAAGSYVHLFTSILQGSIFTSLISIGFMIALIATPDDGKNRVTRLGFLVGFAFMTGIGLGPLLDMAIRINPSIISTAFLGTCLIFGCFSAASLFSEDRKWLYLGGSLMSGLTIMFFLGLANIFFGSVLIFQVNLYVGLFVMCGFILYDTQMIIEKRRRGDQDFIWHSVELFIDFVSIFRRLLIILSQKEDRDRKKSRD